MREHSNFFNRSNLPLNNSGNNNFYNITRINDSFINRNGIVNRNCGKLFTHRSFSFLRFAVMKNRKYGRNIVFIFMRPVGKTMRRYANEDRKTAYETYGNIKIHLQTRNWIIEFRDVVSNIYIYTKCYEILFSN